MSKKSNGFTWFVLIIIVAVLGVLLVVGMRRYAGIDYSKSSTTQDTMASSSPMPAPQDEYQITSTDCKQGVYKDADLKFHIDCPTNMTVYTVLKKDTFYGLTEKVLFMCESQVEKRDGYYDCPTGEVKIWANGDGWGGGCDKELQSKISILGINESYCLTEGGFNHIYLGDDGYANKKDRFYLSGKFSATFSKTKALQVLSSFKYN